jgi:hypothetical protein
LAEIGNKVSKELLNVFHFQPDGTTESAVSKLALRFNRSPNLE